MAYATVMVCLALDQPNRGRLEIAAQLAERFGATVIGVAAAELEPLLYFAGGVPTDRVIDQSRLAIKNQLAALESEFQAAMHNRANRAEWRADGDLAARYIVGEARAADILVVGASPGGRGLGHAFLQIDPGDLVMRAGRPLLVVPQSCEWLDLRSVLVAWKESGEARRAIADALPILKAAREITLAEVVDEAREEEAALARLRDVSAWLARHGVQAFERVERGDAAAQLEKVATSVTAGLIVAGAYGHSRLREWIFGGVTRRLIAPSRRCSLLSR